MPTLIKLTFINRDSGSTEEVQVSRASANHVARWYGAYCAGDDYLVLIDGEIVEKDSNGEIQI